MLDESAGFPRGRLVYGGASLAERRLDLLAGLEQIGPGLLARVALEPLGAGLHVALPRAELGGTGLEPLGARAYLLLAG